MTKLWAAALAMVAAQCLAVTIAADGPPRYVADVSWPAPLPDMWVLGGLGGVCVDAQDHVAS